MSDIESRIEKLEASVAKLLRRVDEDDADMIRVGEAMSRFKAIASGVDESCRLAGLDPIPFK